MSASVVDVEHARVLRAAAREHKRQEAFHRRRAREAMEALHRFCEHAGIAIEIADEVQGGQGHGGRQGT